VARWYDGTTITDVTNAPAAPSHVWIHQNRAFFVPSGDPTRVGFSDLYSFNSFASTNFFYVPSPKTQDWISGGIVFQDNLTIFTRETKHTLYGSDLSSFTRKQAIGTKGAVSQEAIVADRNYIYFMADDKQIYRWAGGDDELLSEKVEPTLRGIADVSKVRFHLYRNQLRVYYPGPNSTVADEMLLLELSNQESNKHLQWFHDTGRSVTGSMEWTMDDNQLIEFSSKVGAVYYGETDESDLGKAISFRYWTAYKTYGYRTKSKGNVGGASAKKRIKRFRPYVRPVDSPYVLSVGKDMDFSNKPAMNDFLVNSGGATWGSFVWNDGTVWGDNSQLINDKVPMSGRSGLVQYRFECSYVDAPVELYGYMSLIKIGRIR
jgi:hypothetical protein